MKIDGNELAIMQNELDQQGFHEEALKIKMEFLRPPSSVRWMTTAPARKNAPTTATASSA